MEKTKIRRFGKLVAMSIPMVIMGATIQHAYAQEVNDPPKEESTTVVQTATSEADSSSQDQSNETTETTPNASETETSPVDPNASKDANVSYETHVQDHGWQKPVSNGDSAGTAGEGKRLEGIKIHLDSDIAGEVQYQVHVQNVGWQDWKSTDELAGTVGQGLRIEAIRMKLIGDLANYYNILYQAHIQNYGWLSWTLNGEYCGSQGLGLRMEALRIRLVRIGDSLDGVDKKTAFVSPAIQYSSHVQNTGWQSSRLEGNVTGTTGEGKRLEAIEIHVYDPYLDGSIQYRAHVQNLGWQPNWSTNGEIAGTVGEGLRVEAIQIQLLGAIAQQYDIYYRAHIQNYGWLDWATNGAIAGSMGNGLSIEAINIRLVKKGYSLAHTGNVVSLDHNDSYDRDGKIITGLCVTNDGKLAYCYQPGKYWHSRTSISSMSGRWINYAINRTGVELPNCFTYATARISEILGHNQSLDGAVKVPGAGDLWYTHAGEFSRHSTPRVGALMIWVNNGYGHVAVVESVYNGIVTWSQSNYYGALFEYITGDPYHYFRGLRFMGYLWHNQLVNL